jgi:hypothetical protein
VFGVQAGASFDPRLARTSSRWWQGWAGATNMPTRRGR